MQAQGITDDTENKDKYEALRKRLSASLKPILWDSYQTYLKSINRREKKATVVLSVVTVALIVSLVTLSCLNILQSAPITLIVLGILVMFSVTLCNLMGYMIRSHFMTNHLEKLQNAKVVDISKEDDPQILYDFIQNKSTDLKQKYKEQLEDTIKKTKSSVSSEYEKTMLISIPTLILTSIVGLVLAFCNPSELCYAIFMSISFTIMSLSAASVAVAVSEEVFLYEKLNHDKEIVKKISYEQFLEVSNNHSQLERA